MADTSFRVMVKRPSKNHPIATAVGQFLGNRLLTLIWFVAWFWHGQPWSWDHWTVWNTWLLITFCVDELVNIRVRVSKS